MSKDDKKEYLKKYYLRNKKELNSRRYENMKKNGDRNRLIQGEIKDSFLMFCF